MYNGFNISDKSLLFNDSRNNSVKALILGIGGMGTNAVTSIFSKGISNIDFAIINVEENVNSNIPYGIKKVILRDMHDKPLSTEGKVEKGMTIAAMTQSAWRQIVDGYSLVIIVAGLGGGTGGGLGPYIASYLKKIRKSLVISIVTMPFSLEGKDKMGKAMKSLKNYRYSSNTTIVLENDTIFKMFRNQSFQKAMEIMNSGIIGSIVETIMDIVYEKSLHMNLDFETLKGMMKNGGESTIIYGEGERKNIENVISSMFNSRFSSFDPSNYRNAIINIISDENFTVDDLETVSRYIGDMFGDKIDVRISLKTVEGYREKIKITGLLIGHGNEESYMNGEKASDSAFIDEYFPFFF